MKTVSFEGRVCFASVSFGLEPFSRTRNALFEVIRQNSIMVIFGWGMKNFNFRGVVRGRFFPVRLGSSYHGKRVPALYCRAKQTTFSGGPDP